MVSWGQCGDIWLALMIVQWLRMIDMWDNVDYHLLRIMMVPVHHCPCLNVCMYRSWHVLVYQSAHRHACVFCKHTSASDWCHVPQYNKCLACSCCVLFGTDRNLCPLLFNKTWYNSKETVELRSGKPVLPLRYELKEFNKCIKIIFSELILQLQRILYLHISAWLELHFLPSVARSSIWPMTWPVQWCGSLTSLVWCCCSVTGMAAFSSWFQCCRTSPQTAGCP